MNKIENIKMKTKKIQAVYYINKSMYMFTSSIYVRLKLKKCSNLCLQEYSRLEQKGLKKNEVY